MKLDAPADWKVTPESQSFQIEGVGQSEKCSFTVTPPAGTTSADIVARATVGGRTFDNRRVEIHYDHIPPLLLQPTAQLKAVALNVAIRGQQVGYLPGAGDSVCRLLEADGLRRQAAQRRAI